MRFVDVELVFRNGSTPIAKSPSAQLITLSQGEDVTIRMTSYSEDGSLRDVTNDLFTFGVAEYADGTGTVINRVGSVLDGPNGLSIAVINDDDTVSIDAKNYYYGVLVNDGTNDWQPMPISVLKLLPSSSLPGDAATPPGPSMILVGLPAVTAPNVGQVLTVADDSPLTLAWAAAGSSLPSQTGNAGKVLGTDGTTASWTASTSGLYVIATDYAGSDLGAKINAAVAFLSGAPGVIVVPPATSYTVSTQVTLEPGVTLSLGAGTYDCTHTGTTNPTLPVFFMKDNTSIVSPQKWGAVLIEPPTFADVCITIADYSRAISNTGQGSKNITIRDVSFIGRSGNTHTGVTACLHFGNCTDVTVEGCRFQLNAGYAANFGGGPDDGFYGKGFYYRNNTSIDVYAQHVAAVNAIGVFVQDNYFRRETVDTAQTFVDLETNVAADKGTLFAITGNIIDAAGGDYFTGSNGIAVLGGSAPANPANVSRGIIANNVINADKDGDDLWYLSSGIALQLAQNVMVFGNSLTRCGQMGISVVASQDCSIYDNDLNECGGQPPPDGNSSAIALLGSKFCQVTENRIRNYTDLTGNTPSILENSVTYYGTVCDYNIIAGNRLYQRPTSTSPGLGIISNITATGANTRCLSNTINGLPVDDPMIATVAELRTVPYPGTRDSSKPPFVRLAGQTTFNDGYGGAWYFDFASSASDNGTNVIAPAYFPTAITAGRWRRL